MAWDPLRDDSEERGHNKEGHEILLLEGEERKQDGFAWKRLLGRLSWERGSACMSAHMRAYMSVRACVSVRAYMCLRAYACLNLAITDLTNEWVEIRGIEVSSG